MAERTCLVQNLGSGIEGGFLAAMMCSKVCSHRSRQVHSNDNPADMLEKSHLGAKLAGRAQFPMCEAANAGCGTAWTRI